MNNSLPPSYPPIEDIINPSEQEGIQCPGCTAIIRLNAEIILTKSTTMFVTIQCPNCKRQWIPSPEYKKELLTLIKQKREMENDENQEKKPNPQSNSGSSV